MTEVWDNSSAASGSVTLSGSGTSEGSDGDCDIDIPAASYTIDPNGGTMAIQPGPQPHYGIQLPFSDFVQATISCPDQDPFTTPFPPPPMMIYTPDPEQTMTRGTYQGTSTLSDPNVSESFSWSLIDP
jgi:hypothetical protein